MHLASEHHSLGAGKAHVLRLTSYVLRLKNKTAPWRRGGWI